MRMLTMSGETMKRLGNIALGVLLACSLVPVSADASWADDAVSADDARGAAEAATARPALEPGTYVEHEAIACVMSGGVRTLSSDEGVLEGAQGLMDIAACAAVEALGDDAEASEAAAFARLLSANGESEESAGRLVLVRDEAKTTAQLIAELEADPRVVFAEPNVFVKTSDADEEAADVAVADEELAAGPEEGPAAAGDAGERSETVFGPVDLSDVEEKPRYVSIRYTGVPVDTTAFVDETGQLAWASGALADGFALVGPESADGAADTYLLAGDGSSGLAQYGKRSSWQKLLAPAATAYRGRLYVLAGAQDEPYRVFSATTVQTAEQPGDYTAPEPGPDPEPNPEPNPEPDSQPEPDRVPGSTLASGFDTGGAPKSLASTATR